MRTNILFRIRLAVLVCATICYIIGLFTKDAYQTFFLDTSIHLGMFGDKPKKFADKVMGYSYIQGSNEQKKLS